MVTGPEGFLRVCANMGSGKEPLEISWLMMCEGSILDGTTVGIRVRWVTAGAGTEQNTVGGGGSLF